MSKIMIISALGAGLYLATKANEVGTASDAPRGIRNNNPGNIEKGENWQGLAADQSSDSRFAVFSEPVWGVRALARVLSVYRNRDGLPGLGGPGVDTIREVLSRWAPDSENNTESYIQAVANEMQVSDRVALQPNDYPALIKAIIRHENGVQPYPDSIIFDGIVRANA